MYPMQINYLGLFPRRHSIIQSSDIYIVWHYVFQFVTHTQTCINIYTDVELKRDQGFASLKEIGDLLRWLGGRSLRTEEFGSEVPENCHPNYSSKHLTNSLLLPPSSSNFSTTCCRRRHLFCFVWQLWFAAKGIIWL